MYSINKYQEYGLIAMDLHTKQQLWQTVFKLISQQSGNTGWLYEVKLFFSGLRADGTILPEY